MIINRKAKSVKRNVLAWWFAFCRENEQHALNTLKRRFCYKKKTLRIDANAHKIKKAGDRSGGLAGGETSVPRFLRVSEFIIFVFFPKHELKIKKYATESHSLPRPFMFGEKDTDDTPTQTDHVPPTRSSVQPDRAN